MSQVKVTGNASGTGTLTIAAPNTNSDYTLTLPAATGNILTSATTTGFPAGSVIQVVQSSLLGGFSTTSSSAVATGLSVSITPTSSSSKILVSVAASGVQKPAGNSANGVILWLYKNGSNLQRSGEYIGYTNTSQTNDIGSVVIDYLDSPATTSSTTYALYIASQVSGQGVSLNAGGDFSTITLMEIAG